MVLAVESVVEHGSSDVSAVKICLLCERICRVEDAIEYCLRCYSEEVATANTLSIFDDAFLEPILSIPVVNCTKLN